MATTLTQSRVKPRNKTGRLVWSGPIRAFRVSRICKEENERGYGLGKVKNLPSSGHLRPTLHNSLSSLYQIKCTYTGSMCIAVLNIIFKKKDLRVSENEAQCCRAHDSRHFGHILTHKNSAASQAVTSFTPLASRNLLSGA